MPKNAWSRPVLVAGDWASFNWYRLTRTWCKRGLSWIRNRRAAKQRPTPSSRVTQYRNKDGFDTVCFAIGDEAWKNFSSLLLDRFPDQNRDVAELQHAEMAVQAYGGSSLSEKSGKKNLYDFLGLKFVPSRLA